MAEDVAAAKVAVAVAAKKAGEQKKAGATVAGAKAGQQKRDLVTAIAVAAATVATLGIVASTQ